jgi:hypothetical protein
MGAAKVRTRNDDFKVNGRRSRQIGGSDRRAQ